MIIFVLWHHLILHIINTLLARWNESIVHRVVWLDKAVEHWFLPCQQIDVLVIPLLLSLALYMHFGIQETDVYSLEWKVSAIFTQISHDKENYLSELQTERHSNPSRSKVDQHSTSHF